jgi:hypothetical protein
MCHTTCCCSGAGFYKIVSFLLNGEYGGARTNLDAVDTAGCTALWVACFNGQRDIVLLLLAAGADCSIAGRGDSGAEALPTHIARSSVNGSPYIADAVAAEMRLREADVQRVGRQRAGGVAFADFTHSVREEEKRFKAAEAAEVVATEAPSPTQAPQIAPPN